MMRRARGALGSITGARSEDGTVRVQGHRMHLDASDSLDLARNGWYELPETRLVNRTIRRGDTVVDIGANIGYYTLILARLVGPEGRVYAFEPDPANFSILERNVALNGYGNVVLARKAVSSKEGTIDLFLSDHNAGMHRSYESVLCTRSVEVEAITLDRFLESETRGIDFIKIDIEGSERPALEGMRAVLGRSRRVAILTEFSPAAMRESGSDPEEYIGALRDLGFALHLLREDGTPVPADPGALSEETRRIVRVTEEAMRSLEKSKPADPSAVVSWITRRLRESGHTGGLTRNLLCLRPSTGADDGAPR